MRQTAALLDSLRGLERDDMQSTPNRDNDGRGRSRRNRETEKQRKGGTESQSNGGARGTEGTQETNETQETKVTYDSAHPIHISTLQEAVQISLKDGITENCLFVFARALKALQASADADFQTPEFLAVAFGKWWRDAGPHLPADADFEEYLLVFHDAYRRARTPLGASSLREAIQKAKTQPFPPESKPFTGKVARLIAVCWHLQQFAGAAAFYLSYRDAQCILETPRLATAYAILNELVHRGLLTLVAKGKPGGVRANRYRFNSSPPK